MNTFQKARLRLTILYILIIAALLMIFSLAAISAEKRAFGSLEEFLGDKEQRPQLTSFLEKRIDRFESDFTKRLLLFDTFLLIGASIAGYFLSGRTLKPIQDMIKEQEEFSADASHELRTPLTTIDTEIEAIKRTEKQIPRFILDAFASIQEETIRMKNTVDGLLTLVREQSYRNRTNWAKFDLSDVVLEAFGQMKLLMENKKVKTGLETHKKLFAYGDKEQIKQVVLILLDNAIKYTPSSGKINIKTSLQGKNAFLTVADTGVGISGKDISYIFDRFYRGRMSKDTVKGSGLGLSIAKKIVERHNGKISVASRQKEGSRFVVRLPYYS